MFRPIIFPKAKGFGKWAFMGKFEIFFGERGPRSPLVSQKGLTTWKGWFPEFPPPILPERFPCFVRKGPTGGDHLFGFGKKLFLFPRPGKTGGILFKNKENRFWGSNKRSAIEERGLVVTGPVVPSLLSNYKLSCAYGAWQYPRYFNWSNFSRLLRFWMTSECPTWHNVA